jgi:peptide/nickel transport system permease protein
VRIILLTSDALLFALLATFILLIFMALRKEHWRRPWKKVLEKPLGLLSLLIVILYFLVALLDSIHFVRALPETTNGALTQYSTQVESVLDNLMAPLGRITEKTYSAPLATKLYTKQSKLLPNGDWVRDYLPLTIITMTHAVPTPTIAACVAQGAVFTLLGMACLISVLLLIMSYRQHSFNQAWQRIFCKKTNFPWYTLLVTLAVLFFLISTTMLLIPYYHVFGTDKVGQDVLYAAIKSIRTGILIGTLTSLVMVPFAVILGMMAGYWGGLIDDIVQYLYTTLSSIPGVLLIAAAILSIQIYITNHPETFTTLNARADIRLLALCFILGITSWTSLCRVLRAETLKLRELDYIQAAKLLGTKDGRILANHILPNIMHIILITVVLDFSVLVLAEAVLTYVGVGVDPSTFSWGNMIDGARLEIAKDPLVWWPLTSAFLFMFVFILAANLLADSVRDAFDPRAED